MRTVDLIAKRFGIETYAVQNPLVAEVGVDPLRVLGNNPGRLGWTIVNLSANNIFLALDRGVGADHGVLLTPNGGSAAMTMDEDFEACCWELFALAAGAASDIWVLEILISKEAGEGV